MDVKAKTGRRASVAGELTPDERAAVVEVARLMGSKAERGPTAGQPSITALLRDIAAGAVGCRRRKRGAIERRTNAAQIEDLKRTQPDLTAPQVAAIIGCAQSTVYAVWGGHRGRARGSDANSE